MPIKGPPLDEQTKTIAREADELAVLRAAIAGAAPVLRVLRDRVARSAALSGRQKCVVVALINGLIEEGKT